MRNILLSIFIFGASSVATAWEQPLQPKCEVTAEILSIAEGKFYWNEKEFYHYYDVGILVSAIKPLDKSDEVLACSPLKEKTRTNIVRIWDWNNKGTAW